MELQVVDHPEQARYEARADGEVAGFIQYHLRDGVIAFLHTEIDPRFRGHGVAGRLVQSTLEAARERHLGVLPYCPFVRGWITEHPDYAALVPEARRPEFGLLFLIATPMSFAAARRFTGDIGDRPIADLGEK